MRLVIDIFCVAGIFDIAVKSGCGAWLVTVIDITGVSVWRSVFTERYVGYRAVRILICITPISNILIVGRVLNRGGHLKLILVCRAVIIKSII